jgi:hypothetical protein
MQWDSPRDALLSATPYLVWLLVALATSILVALVREPLSKQLRDAREQLHLLRTRILFRTAITLGRRTQRFWLARQFDPARSVSAALERLAEALPGTGRRSLARVMAMETELRRQIGTLQTLGLHPPSSATGIRETGPTSLRSGSWGKLLVLVLIAGLAGAANSFLLNEFFQGVITSDSLFPATFPDLRVSHVFAILIFTMEVAIGFALHHFAEDAEDGSAARRLLALAPWVVLVGLLWLEGWAYALLSYQIDIPERLGLSAASGLYAFARYFLALFGAGLTLLLASLGYLLGNEVERLQASRQARRRARKLEPQGWAFHQRAEQIERTEHALARLKSALANFHLDLAHQFKREIGAVGSSEDLASAVRDAVTQVFDSVRQLDGTLGRKLDLVHLRERSPLRTRSQAVAEMSFYTALLGSLIAVGWLSTQYVAASVRSVEGDRPVAELLELVSGVVLTGFGLSSGYVAGRIWGRARTDTMRRLGQAAALLMILAAGGALALVALANRTLGPLDWPNIFFGFLHAGLLATLGAGAEPMLVNTLHALELMRLYLARGVVSLAAAGLWLAGALLSLIQWLVRVVAVFGQLVVRPRPPVQVGVVHISRDTELSRDLQAPARRFADKTSGPVIRSDHA